MSSGGDQGAPIRAIPPPADDWDCDFVKDTVDNCPPLGYDDLRHRNPNQLNSDANLPGGDPQGDWCDNDDDADGVSDWADDGLDYFPNRVKWDNCRIVANADQEDVDHNGVGNVCQFDGDRDGAYDSEDNCRDISNADQGDTDGDRVGDACDNDVDGDFVRNGSDNCPRVTNPQVAPDWVQPDADGDGIGTACDADESIPAPAPPVVPPPAAPGTVTVNDRQAPGLTVRVKSTQRLEEVGGGLVVRLSCSEACSAKAEVVVDSKLARRLKLRGTTVVARGTAKVEGAGATYAFVRFDARARKGIWKLKRTPLTLKVAATDPAGNTRRVSARLTLAR
jgi:hypothetical protein